MPSRSPFQGISAKPMDGDSTAQERHKVLCSNKLPDGMGWLTMDHETLDDSVQGPTIEVISCRNKFLDAHRKEYPDPLPGTTVDVSRAVDVAEHERVLAGDRGHG